MVQDSEPFKNRTKSTIREPDMSGFWIPTVFSPKNRVWDLHVSVTSVSL